MVKVGKSMLRYHKKVYIDPKDLERLKTFTNRLNTLDWQYTNHSIDNIRYRAIDLEGLLRFIKDLVLDYTMIFEFYVDEQTREITKVCYRINWQKNIDIILVVSQEKNIVTIYINSKDDLHYTLKENLYTKEK